MYIYKTLFEEGRDSDVTVVALGRRWRLHRIYLCQSPYFAGMFSGAWQESHKKDIPVEIIDPKITIEAFHAVIGSLYMDELQVSPADVIQILAASRMLHLEEHIDHCAEIMVQSINEENAVSYYEASCNYGVISVKNATFKWLLTNLMFCLQHQPQQLRLIRIVPTLWMSAAMSTLWRDLLKMDQPLSLSQKVISNAEFSQLAVRCGMVILNDEDHSWTWPGFNDGLNLVWSMNWQFLQVKRNMNLNCVMSMHPVINLVIRITLLSLDDKKNIQQMQHVARRYVSLLRNEEVRLLTVERGLTYPLVLCVSVYNNSSPL